MGFKEIIIMGIGVLLLLESAIIVIVLIQLESCRTVLKNIVNDKFHEIREDLRRDAIRALKGDI